MVPSARYNLNFRLFSVCIAAISVGLSIAIISIAKALVLVAGLALLLSHLRSRGANRPFPVSRTTWLILLILAALAVTLAWASEPLSGALIAWAKRGKLLLIPLLVVLVRNRREAWIAMWAYLGAQLFLLLSSWLLVLHLPVPWATARMASTEYAVFSSYLDQSVISCVFAAVCWHLRALTPLRSWRVAAGAVAVLALANTIFVMQGRTGHIVAVALLSLAIMWALPRRWRPAAVLAPLVVVLLLGSVSSRFHDRFAEAMQETIDFTSRDNNRSSSGERLNYWHRSIEAIGERPWTGYGVGSWNAQYNRVDAGEGNARTFTARNPHQEFLLWGVEAGVGGILLLCLLMASLYRDSRTLPVPIKRCVQSTLVALIIACTFNSALFDAVIGDFFCVTLGLLLALGWHHQDPSDTSAIQARALP